MKIFTKIVVCIAGVLAVIGVVCLVIASTMGMNLGTFQNMINEGKFRIDFADGVHINISGDIDSMDLVDKTVEIDEEVLNLEVEYGAGELKICYGDVEKVTVSAYHVIDFSGEVKDKTLYVEGGLGIGDSNDATLVITLPNEMKLETVQLEIGASAALVEGLVANAMKIEVGAGAAELKQLDVLTLDAEVGVGELSVELVGAQTDYNYSLECGIGEVEIGGSSYGGLGASQYVENTGATRSIDLECGIGEVNIKFTK